MTAYGMSRTFPRISETKILIQINAIKIKGCEEGKEIFNFTIIVQSL